MKAVIYTSVCAVFLSVCNGAAARAPEYTIGYDLHETAGVFTSANDFLVTMDLLIDQQDGNSIGWEVYLVSVRELDANGNVTATWTKTYPYVDTPDGLWWIEHADPNSPVNSEFLVPPLIYGTAVHVNPTETPLEFEFEGAVFVAPPGGAPFPDTALLTTLLQQPGTPAPEPKKKETEPVEMPWEPANPYPA